MTKKLRDSRTNGSIAISNVGSDISECITLTYSMKQHLKSLENINKIISEMDALHDEESKVTVTTTNYGTEDEDYMLKYQVKSCGNEKAARKIKQDLDLYVQKQGGQTTLDEGT